jgi:hypothetical protein
MSAIWSPLWQPVWRSVWNDPWGSGEDEEDNERLIWLQFFSAMELSGDTGHSPIAERSPTPVIDQRFSTESGSL